MTSSNWLQRSSPEAQGISSSAVLGFVNTVEQNIKELHSFMLLRHGRVVAEGWWGPYGAQRPHMLFSLSKSFTSTAIGLAVAEGRLSVDDRVLSFFPGDAPARVSKNLAKMCVRDLLTMSTGHAKDPTGRVRDQKEGHWVKGFLAQPIAFTPGTHFVYNSAATYMLSAIIQKLTGGTLLEYLRPRLFEPLGIENPVWETCPRGINTGGWGLSIRTEDIARFGQLYLQKGSWNGAQLVPQDWVAQASAFQISNGENPDSDWAQGYGYQFWRCRHGAYRGDGAFGQYCIVMPEQDAVLAITSGLGDMQAPLNVVWECLLSAMQPEALPANPAAQDVLAQKLASLTLSAPQGMVSMKTAEKTHAKEYALQPNRLGMEKFKADFSGDHCRLTLSGQPGEFNLICGYGAWLEGQAPMLDRGLQKAFISGVWTAEDTFEATVRFVETPFVQTMTCRFGRGVVRIASNVNVGFGQTRLPLLKGRLI